VVGERFLTFLTVSDVLHCFSGNRPILSQDAEKKKQQKRAEMTLFRISGAGFDDID